MMHAFEVFLEFFKLGCVGFGGPAAHIGYFHRAFVEQKQWVSEETYARLIALSQFLPGPGSSQIGFALGYRQSGLSGGIAAFLGFTLPSFLLMFLLAIMNKQFNGLAFVSGMIHGLKLLALVVVADAALGMYQKFCTDKLTGSLCVLTAVLLLSVPGVYMQLIALALAASMGMVKGRSSREYPDSHTGKLKKIPLLLFVLLLAGSVLMGNLNAATDIFFSFYQAGSLVFGGGHVVLPLLQELTAGLLPQDSFLTGYAAAQAVPGPMFSLAAFLGAEMNPLSPLVGALLATAGVFLPGFLLMAGFDQAFESFAQNPLIASAVRGVNAGVVGLLIAALYQPVFVHAVVSSKDLALAMIGLLSLRIFSVSVPVLVAVFAIIGGATSL